MVYSEVILIIITIIIIRNLQCSDDIIAELEERGLTSKTCRLFSETGNIDGLVA